MERKDYLVESLSTQEKLYLKKIEISILKRITNILIILICLLMMLLLKQKIQFWILY